MAAATSVLVLLMFALSSTQAQSASNLSPEMKNYLMEQQTIRCAAASPCPAGLKCILEGSMTTCVPTPNLAYVPPPLTSFNTNRLSRSQRTTTGGILSSLSRYSRPRLSRNQDTRPAAASQPMAVPTKCFLGQDAGRCLGNYPRYFYNSLSGQCERFIFGGCGGNSNQFVSHSECHNICHRTQNQAASTVNTQRLSRKLASNPGSSLFNLGGFRQPPYGDLFSSSLFRAPSHTNGPSPSMPSGLGVPPPLPNHCFHNPESGPCEAAFTRFFYNYKTKSCEIFSFGGCGGNMNNFHTFSDCKLVCAHVQENPSHFRHPQQVQGPQVRQPQLGSAPPPIISKTNHAPRGDALKVPAGWSVGIPPTPPSTCRLNYNKGVCHGQELRFHYNSNTKQCERFGYSGCGGNANNFQSLQDCRRYCVGPELALSQQQPLSVNIVKTATTPLQTAGAAGAPPLSGKHCSLKPDAGPCTLAMKMFFFNSTSNTCEVFHYGGCGGNGNKFESLDGCKRDCDYFDILAGNQVHTALSNSIHNNVVTTKFDKKPSSSSKAPLNPTNSGSSTILDVPASKPNTFVAPATCFLPTEIGPCKAAFRRWHFNEKTGQCEEFNYGGCKPNENNFMTKALCQQQCSPSSPNKTSMGQVSDSTLMRELANQLGNTMDVIPSILGQKNNSPFPGTNSQPPMIGQKNNDICSLPLDSSMCVTDTEFWYYDSSVSACKEFRCNGNGNMLNTSGQTSLKNRFPTAQSCSATCGSHQSQILQNSQGFPNNQALQNAQGFPSGIYGGLLF